jgi:hypothetical protein
MKAYRNLDTSAFYGLAVANKRRKPKGLRDRESRLAKSPSARLCQLNVAAYARIEMNMAHKNDAAIDILGARSRGVKPIECISTWPLNPVNAFITAAQAAGVLSAGGRNQQ